MINTVMRSIHARLPELWRYYQAGIVNALFGFGLYAALVAMDFNIFVAQIVATVIGASFNYVTYSRHVFRDAGPAKMRFAISYVFNYGVSLAALAIIHRFVESDYLAGLGAIIVASLVNYFALRYAVFAKASS